MIWAALWNLEHIRQQQNATDMKLKTSEHELPKLFVLKDGVVCRYDKNGEI